MSQPSSGASIRRRLTRAYASLIFATAAVTLALVFLGIDIWLERRVDQSLAGEFDSLVTHHSRDGSGALTREIERRIQEPDEQRHVYIYTESRYQRIAGNVPTWPEGIDDDDDQRMSLEVSYGASVSVRRVAVESRSLPDGRHLLVGRDVTDDEELMQALAVALSVGLVLIALLGVAGGLSMSRRLLGRVTGMNETVLEISAGRSDERVPHADEGGDEFDSLARHFNRLLDENDRLVTRMREVTDDVAHDLRTPLARVRARIESALAAPIDEQAARETLRALAEDTERILETFNDLIHIAKIESRSVREEMRELSLDELVRDVVELYGPLAEEAGVSLVSATGEGVVVQGNRHLLSRGLTNLIDNALKYAEAAGEITVSARRADGRAELVVRDRGPGIPEDEVEHVLERFVRLDASRSRPGSGLGLSFVSAVAAYHGAELTLSNAKPGLRVRLVFASS
jgi:signal transduction histidine kinase